MRPTLLLSRIGSISHGRVGLCLFQLVSILLTALSHSAGYKPRLRTFFLSHVTLLQLATNWLHLHNVIGFLPAHFLYLD